MYLGSILGSQFSQYILILSAINIKVILQLEKVNIAHFWMASLVRTNCS